MSKVAKRKWTCKICSASGDGTSSEQAHLNGKKHLKKLTGLGSAAMKQAATQATQPAAVAAIGRARNRQKKEAKLQKWADRQVEKQVACLDACDAVISETPTLEASARWAAPPMSMADSASGLHEEIVALCRAASENDAARVEARVAALGRIQKIFGKAFHGSGRAHLIGSAATGLALGSSDLDLTILGTKSKQRESHLYMLAGLLQQHDLVERGGRPQVIGCAKVPIVKFVERGSGLAVDISMLQTDGLQSTAWMRAQLSAHPALRPLLIVLKLFLANHQLNDASVGGISSFVLFVMAHGIVAPSITNADPGEVSDDLGELLCRFLTRFSRTHTRDACWKVASPFDGSDLGKKVRRTAEISAAFRALHAKITPSPVAIDMRPGDWTCPSCGAHVFGSKERCFRCQSPRLGDGGGGGGDGGGGNTYDHAYEHGYAHIYGLVYDHGQEDSTTRRFQQAPAIAAPEDYAYGHDEGRARTLAAPERTLAVHCLHPRAYGDFELFELFSQAGTVTDIQLVSAHKAYVEMGSAADIDAALAISGRSLCGTSIVVALESEPASVCTSAGVIENVGTWKLADAIEPPPAEPEHTRKRSRWEVDGDYDDYEAYNEYDDWDCDYEAPDYEYEFTGFQKKPHGWCRSRPPCWRCGGPKPTKWCRCSEHNRRR